MLPYPYRLADVFRERLTLDGSGRLLDLGCGPGSLTLLLAPLFQEVVAVDADPGMVRVGAAEADRQGVNNVTWLHAYAEDLADHSEFRVHHAGPVVPPAIGRTRLAPVVELGATRVADLDEYGYTWTVMADPEGDEFLSAKG